MRSGCWTRSPLAALLVLVGLDRSEPEDLFLDRKTAFDRLVNSGPRHDFAGVGRSFRARRALFDHRPLCAIDCDNGHESEGNAVNVNSFQRVVPSSPQTRICLSDIRSLSLVSPFFVPGRISSCVNGLLETR
jgi:hypothetical protein